MAREAPQPNRRARHCRSRVALRRETLPASRGGRGFVARPVARQFGPVPVPVVSCRLHATPVPSVAGPLE
jgi:hypothetical protein